MILKGESAEEFNRKADDCKCWLDSKQRILSSDCSVHNQPLKVEVRKADENYEKYKARQKQNLIDMMEADEKLGLYEKPQHETGEVNHVCGLQGFDDYLGDKCPKCEELNQNKEDESNRTKDR